MASCGRVVDEDDSDEEIAELFFLKGKESIDDVKFGENLSDEETKDLKPI